jgi:selenocysteine lyase/cysteine desulfurase
MALTRESFPVLQELAYLNAGSVGPLATEVVEAGAAEEQRALREGRGGHAAFERLLDARERARTLLAELVHAEPAQVALTSSTTDGCQIVLAGLDLGPDDEIVTTDAEHFGLLGPVHASGARVRVARTEGRGGEDAVAAIAAEVGPRTRLLAVSEVFWTTGNRVAVGELRRTTGVPVLVDGAQSAGAIEVDATEVDFLTISIQKWLCGPDAAGALVVRDPDALRVARPTYFSQTAYEADGAFTVREGAARFDSVLWGAPATAAVVAALEGRPADAAARLHAAAANCVALLRDRVELLTGDDAAGLVAWRDTDAAATVERLGEAGVVVRDLPGRDSVRASCGWWTSDDDLQRLAAAL